MAAHFANCMIQQKNAKFDTNTKYRPNKDEIFPEFNTLNTPEFSYFTNSAVPLVFKKICK